MRTTIDPNRPGAAHRDPWLVAPFHGGRLAVVEKLDQRAAEAGVEPLWSPAHALVAALVEGV